MDDMFSEISFMPWNVWRIYPRFYSMGKADAAMLQRPRKGCIVKCFKMLKMQKRIEHVEGIGEMNLQHGKLEL